MDAASGVSVEGVVRRYGTVEVVRDLSFTVDRGQFVSLLGPSGSGKTTTLRMVAGLERPDAGIVRIGGRVMSAPDHFVPTPRRGLGMVFQSYAVWPHKTVSGNVSFPLQQIGVSRSEQRVRVRGMLEMVGLSDHAQHYPGQLSGGQQQRVALARALIAEPALVLFDEPLSNLDARLRDSMRDLIARLHTQLSFSAIYVTHDRVEAMALSSNIVLMNAGGVMQTGSPRDLYYRPASLFVAEFLDQANTLPIDALDRTASAVILASGLRIVVPPAMLDGRSPRHLVLRAHALRTSMTAKGSINQFAAWVKQVRFLGNRIRCVVEVAGATELFLDISPSQPMPEVGSPLTLEIIPEECLLV